MAIEVPLTEEREEKMVSSSGGKNPTLRIGKFLRPCADSLGKAAPLPHVPLLSETISQNLTKWPSEVLFKGCRPSQQKWKQWVDRLAKKHEPTWKKVGIYNAIMSSTYRIQIDRELVLGLSEFWCSETNTFVFPWGEATVTLEDMLILGGFSVLGKPVTTPLIEEPLKKIKEKLIAEHKHLNLSRDKKASHSAWINRFMGSEAERTTELEHVALLALWLSRYCFSSSPEQVIGKHVFSVAVHLSQGTRLALAPAVLASLYRDLRFIYEQVYIANSASFTVWSPFQLLQLWIWERFPLLRPNDSPNPLLQGEPRVGRWHKCSSKVRFKLKLPHVRSILKQIDNFKWRPYVSDVNNWQFPSFYKEREELLKGGCLIEENELQSFVHCIRCCELVGFDYMEPYQPHRVARQFGFDQDLPGHFPRVNSEWKTVWNSYDRHVKNSRLYIRSRFIEAEWTERYLNWWKKSMIVRSEEIKEVLEKRERSKQNFEVNRQAEASKMRNQEQSNCDCWGDHSPGFAAKNTTFSRGKHCEAERDSNWKKILKKSKLNPQVEASKMRDEEQSNRDGWGDHPPGFAPKKTTFSTGKHCDAERDSDWKKILKKSKLNPQVEASKMRDEEQSNLDRWSDHPPGFAPKKTTFSTGKHCDTERDSDWKKILKKSKLNPQVEASKMRDEEQSNLDRWGDHPPGFAPKKTTFSTGKHCDAERDSDWKKILKKSKLNPQVEASKMRDEEQSNLDRWGDHPPGFAPKKTTFSTGKHCETERSSKWIKQSKFFQGNPKAEASKRRNEEQSNGNCWGDHPLGFALKKTTFSTRKYCDIEESQDDEDHEPFLPFLHYGKGVPKTSYW
ncbi:uncharacterized protein LOC122074424 [Macadamia integrifolia]|uniref:uncharacterized protein LOC122074424 n=1 Tax=Macadamia integrifolia TaxID=60698 RepID=UPI001C500504|nr:uncharacterized protein LOC122074424 [Macadamia integrifolia]